MELQPSTESWKMKQQTPQIMDDTAQKPKCTILPSLFEGEEV